MKDILYNSTFVPQGAPPNETYQGIAYCFCRVFVEAHFLMTIAVTVSAGVQWQEAYEAVNQFGRMVVGGTGGGSIGAAGGWLQGGGHSALSPSYGLGMTICAVSLSR